jgi:hypothetical protein
VAGDGEVYVAELIEAPAAEVAARFARFETLHEWSPLCSGGRIEGEGVGATRVLAIGGGEARERLEEVAEEGLGYRYVGLAHPLPITNVRGRVVVYPGDVRGGDAVRSDAARGDTTGADDEGGRCTLVWAVSFESALPMIPKTQLAKAVEAMCRLALMSAKLLAERARPEPPPGVGAEWGADEVTQRTRR